LSIGGIDGLRWRGRAAAWTIEAPRLPFDPGATVRCPC
jgi:hypothetical protein